MVSVPRCLEDVAASAPVAPALLWLQDLLLLQLLLLPPLQ
jgi:hypothetical protein